MRVICVLFAAYVLVGCSGTNDRPCQIDPAIFCGPFAKWEADMPPETQDELKGMTRQDIRTLSRNFGMGVRNEFGLWQDNEITSFFRSCGVDHPDYMSEPFTRGFIAYLNNQPANMCELGKEAIPPEPPPPPPGWQPNNSFKPNPLHGSA